MAPLAVLAVLADPTRRALVERLAAGPSSVSELADGFPVSRPAISRHLRVLREAGLVYSAPVAQQRIYSLRPEPFDELHDWVRGIRRFWSQHLDALDTEVARGIRERTPR